MKKSPTRRFRRLSLLTARELSQSMGGLSIVPEDEVPVIVEECRLAKVKGGVGKRTEVKDAHD